jgi:hypothetical protein
VQFIYLNFILILPVFFYNFFHAQFLHHQAKPTMAELCMVRQQGASMLTSAQLVPWASDLLMRFNMIHKFEDFLLLDWLDNSRWFDVKLLVDPSGGQFDKPMSNDLYADAIKQVLLQLGIVVFHLVHLGRNLRPKLLEMLEEKSDAICQLGNWNPRNAFPMIVSNLFT